MIRGQLEVLATQENPSRDEVLRVERLAQAEITRISRLVDDLLVLAQAERTDFLRTEAIELRPFVTDLWDGVSLTADRRFELGTIANGTLNADPDRLAQALRNLARNAIEHTADHDGLVRLDVDHARARSRPLRRAGRRTRDPARSSASACSNASIAPTADAPARPAAPGSGWRSSARSPRRTEGTVRVLDSGNGRGAQVELVLPGFQPG